MVFHSVPRLPSKYVTLEMSGNSIACAKGLDNLLKRNKMKKDIFLMYGVWLLLIRPSL